MNWLLLLLSVISNSMLAQSDSRLEEVDNPYYQVAAQNYNASDVVVLVEIANCEVSKLGENIYSVTVFAKELKAYKGFFASNNFSFQVTEPDFACYKAGATVGVFLTQSNPIAVKQPHYNSMEASGFSIKDTTVINSFSDKEILATYLKKSLEPSNETTIEGGKGSNWITARIVEVKPVAMIENTFQPQTIVIQPLQDYPKAKMQKGKKYTIHFPEPGNGGYLQANLLRKNSIYELPIWYHTKNESILSNIDFVMKK